MHHHSVLHAVLQKKKYTNAEGENERERGESERERERERVLN